MKNRTAGQIIRFYREQEGLTQEELAEIMHVTKGKLSHWENDKTIPRPAMVARLIGALRLSEDRAAQLKEAVEDAALWKAQEKAEIQAMIDEQNAEAERLKHQRKAVNLLCTGIAGFFIGCMIAFLTGSYKDNPWYFAPAIGILVAGIPFSWSFLTDSAEKQRTESYYDPINREFNFIMKLCFFILKFIGAYLIGIFVFPIIFFYHAYKAGKKGSLYKKIMCAVLILVTLFIGVIAFFVISTTFPSA